MNNYPALLDLATQKLHPLGVSESFLVGRNETADVCVLDVTCSRHHFRIVRHDGHYFIEPLNAANPTYHNGQPPRGPCRWTTARFYRPDRRVSSSCCAPPAVRRRAKRHRWCPRGRSRRPPQTQRFFPITYSLCQTPCLSDVTRPTCRSCCLTRRSRAAMRRFL